MADSPTQWHYVREGITFGPVDTAALVQLAAARVLRPESPVWNASFGAEWLPAGAIPELAEAFAAPTAAPLAAPGRLPPLFPGADAAPRPWRAFGSAWAWSRKVLFQPFRFFQWLTLWVAFWLAMVGGTVGVFDQQTLLNAAPRVRDAGGLLPLALQALRKGLEAIFDSGFFVNWLLLFSLFGFATCYFRARGRLMLVHFADHPGDPLSAAWRRARPGLWPLAIFHFTLDLVKTAVLLNALWHFTGAFPTPSETTTSTALLRALAQNGAALRWLAIGGAGVLAVALARSITYHFAEPLVYRFGMRTRRAWLYVIALFLRRPLAFLGYYLALAALHIALWAALGALLLGVALATLPLAAIAAPLAAAFAAFLSAIGRFAVIPFLYMLRCAGPRFLDAWRKDLR